MKTYRPYAPNQSYLLPPSPGDWLPEGHLAYFVLDWVEDLDLSAIERVIQAKDARGERPYSPRMMTALLVYGYAVGVFSSRKIERATHEDVGFRVLAGGEHPKFTTINEFRLTHHEALAGLFHQILEECMSAGLVKLGHVAIDGTKLKANASKHKAMSYERMNKDEARLTTEIAAYLAKAAEVDAAEDELYGVGQQPENLPAELQRREGRREKFERSARHSERKRRRRERRNSSSKPMDCERRPRIRRRPRRRARPSRQMRRSTISRPPISTTTIRRLRRPTMTCPAIRRQPSRRASQSRTRSGTSPTPIAGS